MAAIATNAVLLKPLKHAPGCSCVSSSRCSSFVASRLRPAASAAAALPCKTLTSLATSASLIDPTRCASLAMRLECDEAPPPLGESY